jgi:adenosine kinase
MADYMAVNDYEAQLIQDRTGHSIESLAPGLKALVVTLGAKGSAIYADGQRIEIPCVEAEAVVDPTGCGDAYRAGLLYGIARGWDWQTCGRLASVMGSIKIASRGGQNHAPQRMDIEKLYESTFNEQIILE